MSPSRHTVSSLKTADKGQTRAPASKSAPIPLDPSTLKHVAGGLSPKGTWGEASAMSPKGTW